MPIEIRCSWFSLAALAATIRLALAFFVSEDPPASPPSKTICRTRGAENLASPMLQLLQGALARCVGIEVSLEPTLEGAETPADIELFDGVDRVGVEAFALLMDKKTLDASAFLAELRPVLGDLGVKLGVDFRGEVEKVPTESERAGVLDLLESHLRLVGLDLTLPPLALPGLELQAVPAAALGGASHIRLPTVSFGERIGSRLRKKAAQAERSGARWLSLEDFDPLWHLTEFGSQPAAAKAAQITALIRSELSGADHLLGVTFSDGAAMMRPEAEEETIEAEAHVMLIRRCDAWRVRESVILTLRPGGERSGKMWRRILEAESGWTGRELRRHGLAVPRELVGASGQMQGRAEP